MVYQNSKPRGSCNFRPGSDSSTRLQSNLRTQPSPSLGLFAARKSELASQARRDYLSSGALELERYVELGAIGLYFSFGVELNIEFDYLCDAKISERFCG